MLSYGGSMHRSTSYHDAPIHMSSPIHSERYYSIGPNENPYAIHNLNDQDYNDGLDIQDFDIPYHPQNCYYPQTPKGLQMSPKLFNDSEFTSHNYGMSADPAGDSSKTSPGSFQHSSHQANAPFHPPTVFIPESPSFSYDPYMGYSNTFGPLSDSYSSHGLDNGSQTISGYPDRHLISSPAHMNDLHSGFATTTNAYKCMYFIDTSIP